MQANYSSRIKKSAKDRNWATQNLMPRNGVGVCMQLSRIKMPAKSTEEAAGTSRGGGQERLY